MVTQDIWNKYHDVVHGFVRRRVFDPHDVNDLVQDIFLKINLGVDSLRDKEKVGNWIYQIARNTISDYYRKKGPTDATNPASLSTHDDSPQWNGYLVEFIPSFVDQLDCKDKEAIVAADIKGISQKEFAQAKGLSYSAAKSRIQRAREKLKLLFNECCRIKADRYGNILDVSDEKKCTC